MAFSVGSSINFACCLPSLFNDLVSLPVSALLVAEVEAAVSELLGLSSFLFLLFASSLSSPSSSLLLSMKPTFVSLQSRISSSQ